MERENLGLLQDSIPLLLAHLRDVLTMVDIIEHPKHALPQETPVLCREGVSLHSDGIWKGPHGLRSRITQSSSLPPLRKLPHK